ncbi:MAG: PEP-CTERM sorting domain-containing protein [Phycisphaerae bacterium]|nr:PEP-CTERM sorting domain-containing protein [Phycisphaerae bacterium]NUQ46748.1 PEP-CTERM sorting domain-containing protein [Phycisphaerae bacterium]
MFRHALMPAFLLVAAQSSFGQVTQDLPFARPPWFDTNPGNGVITINNADSLTVTGDNSGLDNTFTGLSIIVTCPLATTDNLCYATFTLDSYFSDDDGIFDAPTFKLRQGVTDTLFPLLDDNGDVINNANQTTDPFVQTFPLGPANGGPYEIGLGVFSVDGVFGPGVADFSGAQIHTLPEPGTLALLMGGALVALRRRRA